MGTIIAGSISFGVYFAIAGSVFSDLHQVPQYKFHDWQLRAGIPLGVFAARLVTALALIMQVCDTGVQR